MAKVEDFTAWKIFSYVLRQFQVRIRRANGYNTDPFITAHWQKAEKSDVKHTVFIEGVYNDGENHSVGDADISRQQTALGIKIEGSSTVETEIPRMLAMMLEQDIRNAWTPISSGMRAAVGKGCISRLHECQYDQGLLGPEDQVGFMIRATVSYPSGPIW